MNLNSVQKARKTNQSKYLYMFNNVKFSKIFRITSEVSEDFQAEKEIRKKERNTLPLSGYTNFSQTQFIIE